MRSYFFILLIIVFAFGCIAKDSTPAGVQDDLKTAMQAYLYNAINNDSSNAKYRVEDVHFYDDKERGIYICVFTVNLKEKLFDTTGTMKANISKDFKKITRLQ
ncbi:MAG: hypothetical protein ABJB05_17260 [Parafilimonas sp.]